MTLLIENLAAFNRKERFHLLSFALGLQQSHIAVSDSLKESIERTTGCEVPAAAFLAMDYHLDWLTAALEITRLGLNASDIRFDSSTGVPPFERGPSGRINGTQEDVDLLVAFPSADTGRTVLVMIEAKSDTSWGTSQLTSKGERLRKILGEAENEWGEIVQPYFLLTSPREPEKLDYGVLPAWARLTKQWF